MSVHYLFEPAKGQSNARNAGLAHAQGDFILFTDDDVLFDPGWVKEMVTTLAKNECEAVTGHFKLAAHLSRPWMTSGHRWWLASSHDAKPHEGSRELIGGNMGIRRCVLKRVPAFDPELGPGALGFGEDTLFGWQLVEAGYRIGYASNATVVHQLDPFRLRRSYWLNDARKRGQTKAYLAYHWEHKDLPSPALQWLAYGFKLRLRRLLQPPPPLEAEGCPLWDMGYLMRMEESRHFCRERRRPRNYQRRGLVKLSVVSSATPPERTPVSSTFAGSVHRR
jgi:GT2 family glycosyltransferase